MAQVTAGDLQTLEYQTIRQLSNILCTGIQNADLKGIVTKLFSDEIISEDEWKAITDPETREAANVRADRFMKVLLDKIKINPECFVRFRQILAEELAHKSLVDNIDKKLEELKKTRQTTPKQQTATVHNQPVQSQGANSLNQNHFPVKSTSMDDDCTFRSQLEKHLFKAGEIAPNNLPHFPGPFVGRDRDVSNITNTLLSNHSLVKMVHIFGLPAVGKSTLAVHVGYKMASHRVAVRYINVDESHLFKSHEEPKPSDSIILTESHTQKATQAVTSPTAFTLSWYSHTEKSFVSTTAQGLAEWAKGLSNATLLILDNCDILLQGMEGRESDFISLLDSLNEASPYLCIVTTSRLKVKSLDAKPYDLKPLDNNSAIELLQLVSPTMTSNESRTINNLLDGIPLALKIVGSLVSEERPPNVIIAELQQNLMQTLSPEDVRPEKQKMRPVLRLSFKYLDNSTQDCALYLSHFPGSFSQEAALNILSNCTNKTRPELEECLQNLNKMSLLNAYFYAGQSRYRFHRLIKDYLMTDVETHTSSLSMKAVRFKSSFFLHYIKALCTFVDIYNQVPYDEENIGRFEYESHNFEYLLEVAKVHVLSISTTTDLIYVLKCDLMEIFTTEELLKVGQRILVKFEDRMDVISTKIGAFKTLKLYFDLQIVLKKWIQSSRNCEVLCEETFPRQRHATRIDIIDRQLSLVNYSAYVYYQRLSFPLRGIGESICVTYCLTERKGSSEALMIWILCNLVFTTSIKNINWKVALVVPIFSSLIYWIGITYSVSSIIYSVYIAIFLGLRHPPLQMMVKHVNLRISYCTVLCVLLICMFRKTNVSVAYNFFVGTVVSHLVYRQYATFGVYLLHFGSFVFLLSSYILD